MKLWIKILLVLIAIFLLILSAIYVYFLAVGKFVIVKQLEDLTKSKINISDFKVSFPLTLKIKHLDIGGLGRADYIIVSPSILGFLTGNVVFNNITIINPELSYERSPAPAEEVAANKIPVAAAEVKTETEPPSRLVFKQINIRGGKINFVDNTVNQPGIHITIKDIDFKITNLSNLRQPTITSFELKGKIPWTQGQVEGKIEVEGWLNIFKKDMQATLKVEDIDGIYLYPYYSAWVDLEKARIEKAKLNFFSNIQGLNNDVIAQCRLELTDIVRRPRPPDEPQEKAARLTDAVLDKFRSLDEGKIVLEFPIKTKMDKPEFGFGEIKMAFEKKLAESTSKDRGIKPQEVLTFPAKLVEGTFKGATQLTTALIGGVISAGKEIEKAFEAAFRKEKIE